MAFEQNPDCGSLFRNDRATKETDRSHNGDAKVTCPHCKKTADHWLSAWVNDMKNKPGKYFSIRFSPKDDQSEQREPAAPVGDLDDDIPF